MHILVLVGRTSVDHLEFFIVDQNASRKCLRSLVVVLAGGKDGKDSGALADGNTLRVRLVGSHNVRKTLLLEKIRHGLVSETNGSATTEGFSVTGIGIDAVHFLFRRGGIAPDAIGGNLLIDIVFVHVGRIDAGNLGDVQNVLDAGGGRASKVRISHGNRAGNSAVDTKNILVDNRGQGQTIKDLVARLPEPVSNVIAESVSALPDKGSFAIVLLPSVDIACLVVSSEQKDLVRVLQLHR
mmetsp:Transcript_18012/g.44827  ORF Transcript_18012/g.44827 Transcript_18012/m.44827 type:complete len:240 (-) Transcript_18012:967-1686(-)